LVLQHDCIRAVSKRQTFALEKPGLNSNQSNTRRIQIRAVKYDSFKSVQSNLCVGPTDGHVIIDLFGEKSTTWPN
jgi:hypothetical protein